MTDYQQDEQLFQRYLLGDLGEEERERLQERYFVDAGLFSRLLSAETDLIDAYGRGELTEEDRKRFEQRFSNNRDIDKRVKFANVLSRAADQHSTNSSAGILRREAQPSVVSAPSAGFPWLASIGPSFGSRVVRASVVGVAAVIVLTVALVIANRFLPTRQPEPGVELASSLTNSPPGQQTILPNTPVALGPTEPDEKSRSAGAPPTIKPQETRQRRLPKAPLASISIVLHEGITRAGGQTTEVVLSPTTRSLQMQLEVPYELQTSIYSSYQATLQTVSGQQVIRREELTISKRNGGSSVRVNIPVELLTTRDYIVLLSGERSDGTQQYLRGYSFNVTRK